MTAMLCEEETCSEALSGNENEENTKGGIDENSHRQDHDSPLSDELTDVRLTDAREVEWGVLAVTNQGHDGIQWVLVRRKEINTNSEGQDELVELVCT
jgi:hypothetical protein